MPVLQRLANATSSAAHAAAQPTLLVERFTDTTPGSQRLSPAAIIVVAIVVAGVTLCTVGVLCAACLMGRKCGRRAPADRFLKPRSHGCYLTQLGRNKPRRRDEEHNPKPPRTPASIVMDDWNDKNDSSDSVGPQYVGARSAWGPTPGYGVAGHQPHREEFSPAALQASLQAGPLTTPAKVYGANRF
ncbi:hypothetical protein DL769_000519 [Monosporascus sp. CRB-8-3]|nr:hypothetical protein DL769_000519 [Monosporascus sp. CRB-8-3]